MKPRRDQQLLLGPNRLEQLLGDLPPTSGADPYALTCSAVVLTLFPSPPRGENGERSWSPSDSTSRGGLFVGTPMVGIPRRAAVVPRASPVPESAYAIDKYTMAIATRAPESSHIRRTLGAGAGS